MLASFSILCSILLFAPLTYSTKSTLPVLSLLINTFYFILSYKKIDLPTFNYTRYLYSFSLGIIDSLILIFFFTLTTQTNLLCTFCFSFYIAISNFIYIDRNENIILILSSFLLSTSFLDLINTCTNMENNNYFLKFNFLVYPIYIMYVLFLIVRKILFRSFKKISLVRYFALLSERDFANLNDEFYSVNLYFNGRYYALGAFTTLLFSILYLPNDYAFNYLLIPYAIFYAYSLHVIYNVSMHMRFFFNNYLFMLVIFLLGILAVYSRVETGKFLCFSFYEYNLHELYAYFAVQFTLIFILNIYKEQIFKFLLRHVNI